MKRPKLMNASHYYHRIDDRCFILNWLILTLDEKVEPLLPLQRRWHLLNWSKLNDNEKQEISSHFGFTCESNAVQKSPPLSINPDAPAYQFSNRFRDDRIMLRYRNHFDFVTEEQYLAVHNNPPCIGVNSNGVTLIEYFEDMSRQSISNHEIMQRVHGPGCILMGDLRSILTVGPSPMKDQVLWGIVESNLLAHFFSVIEQIAASHWVSSTSEYTKSNNNVVDSKLPRLHEFRSIIILFRQLYEARGNMDDLLRKAANRYMEAIDCNVKTLWIQCEIDRFDAILSQEPMGMHGHGVCGKEFLEAFGYGYRLFHAQPKFGGVEKLESLVKRYSPEEVIFSVDYTLRHLYKHANNIYNLIRFDLSRWEEDKCPKPTLLDLRDILGN